MPDRDGYEILPARSERRHVLHHPCDRHVENTDSARRAHSRECHREQERAAVLERRASERASRDALRLVNRERRLEREILRCAS